MAQSDHFLTQKLPMVSRKNYVVEWIRKKGWVSLERFERLFLGLLLVLFQNVADRLFQDLVLAFFQRSGQDLEFF